MDKPIKEPVPYLNYILNIPGKYWHLESDIICLYLEEPELKRMSEILIKNDIDFDSEYGRYPKLKVNLTYLKTIFKSKIREDKINSILNIE